MADDILKEALDAFDLCESVEKDNRTAGLADLRFARLGAQWPENIRKQRELEGRPCLTINTLPAFIRQVVNDSRQNKPGIAVHPVESGDKETAEIIGGIIRNIEKTSNADVAYDTAVDSSASTGVGYIGVNLDYACDDTFEQDIVIKAKPNRFAIYGDPYSQCADSSDWNTAFEIEEMPEALFKKKYPKAKMSDFGMGQWANGWCDTQAKKARVALYWTRSEVMRELVQWQAEGQPIAVGFKDDLAKLQEQMGGIQLVAGPSRMVKSYKVKQYTLTANEILSEIDWAGRYIPLIPIYGEEVNEEGKRHFRSLIHDAKDSAQMKNFFRTNAAEIVAYAPRAPYIGRKGAFASDPRWATANNATHPFLEYDGPEAPQRTPFNGISPGDIQEAASATDDLKAIMGIYDASLGARSNETSGRAIMARQREGDVSTFHFIDNLARGIRHLGVVVIDLIQKTYTTDRIIRIMGEDGKPDQIKVTGEKDAHNPGEGVYNLTLGKYDLTVKAGGNYTSQREQALDMLTELVRAQPDAAAVLGDIIIDLMDIPGGDKAMKRLQAMLPPQIRQAEEGENPEAAAAQQQAQQITQQAQQAIQQMQQALQEAQAKAADNQSKAVSDDRKLDIEEYKAVTDRMAMAADKVALSPEAIQALIISTMQDIVSTTQDVGDEGPGMPEGMMGYDDQQDPMMNMGGAMEPMPQGMGQPEGYFAQ